MKYFEIYINLWGVLGCWPESQVFFDNKSKVSFLNTITLQ